MYVPYGAFFINKEFEFELRAPLPMLGLLLDIKYSSSNLEKLTNTETDRNIHV
jgi:hypothetical protein